MAGTQAVLSAIADAVVSTINGATLSQTVTAKRVYVSRSNLPDLATLQVIVAAKPNIDLARLDRSRWQENHQIDVVMQKRVANDAEADGLLGLAQDIFDLFKTAHLTSFNAVLTAAESVPYWPDHMKESNVLTNVLTLTFQVGR